MSEQIAKGQRSFQRNFTAFCTESSTKKEGLLKVKKQNTINNTLGGMNNKAMELVRQIV